MSNITVTLIDSDKNERLGVVGLSTSDLPETFVVDTTLHIGPDEWAVINAAPSTRAEFEETKALTLWLRRVVNVDPRNILFSLPSICDQIPPTGNVPTLPNDLALAEDGWRQLELVDATLAGVVDSEIEAIRMVREESADIAYYRSIHVRAVPIAPIPPSLLTLGELASAFGRDISFGGVSYENQASRIAGGYSFAITGAEAAEFRGYGLIDGGHVLVLAFVQGQLGGMSVETIDRLVQFAAKHNLQLVDWCRCLRVDAADPGFRELLGVAQ